MVLVEERRVKRSWEELISEGMNAREAGDESNWKRGDLANEVTISYGDNSIGKYAYAISTPKKTLMNYRTTANKFDKDIRKKYKKLSFSHFAILTSAEKPEAWLEKADTEEWSVETLRREVKKENLDLKGPGLSDDPPEVYRCPECERWRLKGMSSFEICKGHYKITKKGKIIYK